MPKIAFQSPYSADVFTEFCDEIGVDYEYLDTCIIEMDDFDPDEISQEDVDEKISELGGSYIDEYEDEEE